MDIILEGYDVAISNGDFVVGDTFFQDQQLLLETDKGDWKEHPDVGVGCDLFLDDESPDEFHAEIRAQYRRAGMEVHRITLTNGETKIMRK